MAAHRQEDRGEVPAQLLQLDVPSQPGPEAHFDPQLFQEAGLPVQDLPGQAVSRHIEAQGAAQMRFGLEQGYPVAFEPELIGGHEPGRAAAHHGDGFRPLRAWRNLRPGFPVQVGQISLQSGDGDGPAQRASGTGGLAGPGADAAENAGKGAALQHHRQGLGRPAFLQAAHLVPHPDIQRTGGLAGRRLLPDALRQDLVAPLSWADLFFRSFGPV